VSDIRVDTISAANGTDPVTLTKQSAAKATVTMDDAAGIQGTSSTNISSTTDVGTGDYRIYFTNSFNSTWGYSGNTTANSIDDALAACKHTDSGGVQISIINTSAAPVKYDKPSDTVVHGDLA